MKKLRYGLIGVGPIGCALAAHLSKSGSEVFAYSIDPESTLALRSKPIKVSGALQTQGRMARVHTQLSEFLAEKPDVILIATKSCHNRGLLEEICRLGGAGEALAISCQNGLNTEDALAEVFGKNKALRMVMNIGCRFLSKSDVEVKFFLPHVLSLVEGADVKVVAQIVDDLVSSGFAVTAKSDYQRDVFKKVILNSSLGTICALTGLTMRAAVDSPEIEAVIRALVEEGIALSRAAHLDLSPAFTEEAMCYLRDAGDHKPSMALDVEHGRATENDDHCGALVKLAERLGIEMPVTRAMYYLLKELEVRSMHKVNH